jgi:hypothetical protein
MGLSPNIYCLTIPVLYPSSIPMFYNTLFYTPVLLHPVLYSCSITSAIYFQLFSYQYFGENCPLNGEVNNSCYYGNIGFLLIVGLLVNGPYALITTAVSAELGTHPSLEGSSKALATVTSVIDGTGSIGAAIGPFLAGSIGLENVFYMLMAADVLALVVSVI